MKIEFVKTSYKVYERVKIDGEYVQPTIQCYLTCQSHFDNKMSDYVFNGVYGSDVYDRICGRLGQAGYSVDFINAVLCEKQFNVVSSTTLHSGDEYDENLGRHIAETKARIEVFKIMSIISTELEKYFREASNAIEEMNKKSTYLFEREKKHLQDVFSRVVSNKDDEAGE